MKKLAPNRRRKNVEISKIRQPKTRVRTAKGRKISSTKWLERQLNDQYVAAAKRDGYRSRSAYKLIQLNERFDLLNPNMKVVDLGAAPGGWSQVITNIIHKRKPKSTGALISLDILEMEPIPGATILRHDFLLPSAPSAVLSALSSKADAVFSDIAPPLTGHSGTDHIRIVAAVEAAYNLSCLILGNDGCFVAKVFQGGTEQNLLTKIKSNFASVKHAKPDASRDQSSEIYIVAKGFKGAK